MVVVVVVVVVVVITNSRKLNGMEIFIKAKGYCDRHVSPKIVVRKIA